LSRFVELQDIKTPNDYLRLIAWGNLISRSFVQDMRNSIRVGNVNLFGQLPFGVQGTALPLAPTRAYILNLCAGNAVPAPYVIPRGFVNPFFMVQAIVMSFAFTTVITFEANAIMRMAAMPVSAFTISSAGSWYNALQHWQGKRLSESSQPVEKKDKQRDHGKKDRKEKNKEKDHLGNDGAKLSDGAPSVGAKKEN